MKDGRDQYLMQIFWLSVVQKCFGRARLSLTSSMTNKIRKSGEKYGYIKNRVNSFILIRTCKQINSTNLIFLLISEPEEYKINGYH